MAQPARSCAISTTDSTDQPRAGEVLRFLGWGCLPYDGISDWAFERMDGTPINVEFFANLAGVSEEDTLIWPGGDRPATIRPIPLIDERAEVLDTVAMLLRAVRAESRDPSQN